MNCNDLIDENVSREKIKEVTEKYCAVEEAIHSLMNAADELQYIGDKSSCEKIEEIIYKLENDMKSYEAIIDMYEQIEKEKEMIDREKNLQKKFVIT